MSVDTKHREYAPGMWAKCRVAAAGQDAVHEAGEAYLPKLSEQTGPEYASYKGRALYFNATGRTVDGMSGLVFRRPPSVELPAAVDFLNADADSAGTPALTMCEQVVEEVLTVGRLGLLVDFPRGAPAATQAQEQAAGLRPYVKLYQAEAIINWRTALVGGAWQLTLVVLTETHEEVAGFDVICMPQWRVLKLDNGIYTVELWRKGPDDKEPVLVDTFVPLMAGQPMRFIPFVVISPMGLSAKVAKSPINDLADVNLSHYRTTADYEHGLHFTGLPTPVVTGHQFSEGEKFALGSTAVKAFGNPEAKAYFLEFEGKGLEALATRLEAKEAMMVALGARMLAADKRAAEAAETAAIHRAGESSVLASLANAASAGLSRAFTWCAQWVRSQEPVVVTLNTDYLPTGLTSQELTALVGAWQQGAISYDTLFTNLKRGEVVAAEADAQDERDKIDAEGPPGGGPAEPPTGDDPLA